MNKTARRPCHWTRALAERNCPAPVVPACGLRPRRPAMVRPGIEAVGGEVTGFVLTFDDRSRKAVFLGRHGLVRGCKGSCAGADRHLAAKGETAEDGGVGSFLGLTPLATSWASSSARRVTVSSRTIPPAAVPGYGPYSPSPTGESTTCWPVCPVTRSRCSCGA